MNAAIVVLNNLKLQIKNEFGDLYTYEVAKSVDEAMVSIAELKGETTTILAIISDWLMPVSKEDEFLIQLHQKFSQTVKVMLAGQANEAAVEGFKTQTNPDRCLYKPWNKEKPIETIKSGLAQP